MNLEQRAGIWYATILVPEGARRVLGRVRFKKSMRTGSKREAQIKAAPILANWKAQILQAQGSSNAVATEAMRWREAFEGAPDDGTLETYQLALSDEAERIEEKEGLPAAQQFYAIASGAVTPSGEYFERWKAQIKLAPKTKDQMLADVSLLVAKFPTLQGISKGPVRNWVDELTLAGKGPASVRRILSFCRNYWRFLQRYEAVGMDSAPFTGVFEAAPNNRRKANNLPYSETAVVALWEAAALRRYGPGMDTQLADLIMLGAYTGARIEELCSLKTAKVKAGSFKIEDAKTVAGWREVPIHSAIAPLIKRLVQESKDGYLLSGLTFNKYEDRSNAIGKRFGRLKTALGHLETHTFHSFRSTVATQLENASVPEGVTADILGHDKPSMTYGLYSGGATLETKREALGRVSYPFPSADATAARTPCEIPRKK